ncbi:ABC transporter permease, partial [Streptomyces mutabilis]|uniref:ABC transporter permease n=1 Tax=Streptomyces mutabilis TaxID=67332 RepID=UPI0022D50CD3|nr:ABC transporter permease [Streptomyces mutabilis]
MTAPWVRTRLRAAPGAAGALALLVALTACLAAALPRALDRYADAGLSRAVEQVHAGQSSVQVTADPGLGLEPAHQEDALRPESVAGSYESIVDTVESPLAVDGSRSAYGVRTTTDLTAADEWLPRPDGLPARMVLATPNDLAGHARLRSGRLPRVTGGPVTASTDRVEAAVTEETARTLRIEAGSVIHVRASAELTVHVTGIVAPRDPEGPHWSVWSVLRAPSLVRTPGGDPNAPRFWRGGLLLPPEAAPALLGTDGDPVRYWHLAPDTDALHGRDLDRLGASVASLESGPGTEQLRSMLSPFTEVETGLDSVFTTYDRLRGDIGPLVAVAAAGAGTVAAVVLLMTGGLAAGRRRAELALLRARGVSLKGMTGRLLAETAVVALPAGALGLAVAVLALPGARLLPALCAAGAVTAVACLTLPLRAA